MTDTNATFFMRLDEEAVVSFVLLPNNGPAPSAAAVIAGTDGNGDAPLRLGSVSVQEGQTGAVSLSTGLVASTAYVELCVAGSTLSHTLVPTQPHRCPPSHPHVSSCFAWWCMAAALVRVVWRQV